MCVCVCVWVGVLYLSHSLSFKEKRIICTSFSKTDSGLVCAYTIGLFAQISVFCPVPSESLFLTSQVCFYTPSVPINCIQLSYSFVCLSLSPHCLHLLFSWVFCSSFYIAYFWAAIWFVSFDCLFVLKSMSFFMQFL